MNFLFSPQLVPVVAIVGGCCVAISGIWWKIRQLELEHEMRLKEMEHAREMKALEARRASEA